MKSYVEIIEQPGPSITRRFINDNENNESSSSILDANSSIQFRIKVHEYTGPAVVIISTVTKDEPFRPHPFKIYANEGIKYDMYYNTWQSSKNAQMKFVLPPLGVQCVKKEHIKKSLELRKSKRVDPFRTGVALDESLYDMNSVRLCFQVFIEGTSKGKFDSALDPVVSNPIDNEIFTSPCNNLNNGITDKSKTRYDQSSQIQPLQQNPSHYGAYIEIEEQPSSYVRFRYESEMPKKSSLFGENSTKNSPTYPTIKVVGYKGNVDICISLVTNEMPYRPHPHKLWGTDVEHGIYYCMLRKNKNMIYEFRKFSIICVKKKDWIDSLKIRENQKIDPFKTGYQFDSLGNKEQNSVRLCFQVLIEDPTTKVKYPLSPIVSNVIYDSKTRDPPKISFVIPNSATVDGGIEVFLGTTRFHIDDIQVRIYQMESDVINWERLIEIKQTHQNTGLIFEVPKYLNQFIKKDTKVFFELFRPSDQKYSNKHEFTYKPLPKSESAEIIPYKKMKYELENPQSLMSIEVNPDSNPVIPSNEPLRIDNANGECNHFNNFSHYRSSYSMNPQFNGYQNISYPYQMFQMQPQIPICEYINPIQTADMTDNENKDDEIKFTSEEYSNMNKFRDLETSLYAELSESLSKIEIN